MELLPVFTNSVYNAEKEIEVEQLRDDFLRSFPKESILDMNLDDFLYGKKGSGYEHTFCTRMRTELEPLAHMGNAWPSVFGVYLSGGTVIKVSPTYKAIYKDDADAAYRGIKSDIVSLFRAYENGEYDAIAANRLNAGFKSKLLLTYYHEAYFPVVTASMLDAYCKLAGVSDMGDAVEKNRRLVEWKEGVPEFSDKSLYFVMWFLDWLYDNNLSIIREKQTL